MLLATAAVLLEDGTVEGRRGETIDYTDRWVCTHSDLELHRQTEWLRVKALPGDGAPWVTSQRKKDDGIFEKDPVTKLSGIGEEKAKELKRVGKVKEVAHFA